MNTQPGTRMRLLRRCCAAVCLLALAVSLACYLSYRHDQGILKEVALRETRQDASPAERAIQLTAWVHHNKGFGKNKGYFLIRQLGPLPTQVLESGGDCADKSRLLSSLLRELDIPSSLAMCFDEQGAPTHTVVNATLPDGSQMVLDPVWNLYFPKDQPGQYYGLLELRQHPDILGSRLEVVTSEVPPDAHVRRYNRAQDVYDRASTINWEKNALTRSLKGVLAWWLGDGVFVISRPSFLEEPKLFLSVAALLVALAALAVRAMAGRVGRRRPGEASAAAMPAGAPLEVPLPK